MAQIGGGQSPDIFGSGQYQVNSFDIDKNAFYNDPNKKNNQQAQQFISQYQNRQGPQTQSAQLGQAVQAQPTQANEQFRIGQAGLVGQLSDAAAGRGPSLATAQLGQANAAAAASRMSQAASERGYGGGAATNRELAYQQGAANQGNAIASAQLRLQEQQQAQQALGNVLNSARGGDITQAQLNQNNTQFNATNQNQFQLQQAQLQQQANLANQAAQLQTMGYNDEQIRSMLGLSTNINSQNQQNQIGYNQLGVQQNTALQGIQAQAYNNAANNALGGKIVGAISQGAGAAASLAAMSDERQKDTFSKIEANKDMLDFLDNLGNHKYTYKNPEMSGADDKIHFSPMAQELEKTNIGKSMVINADDGFKRVDYMRGMGTVLSGLGLINSRLKKLEGK